MLNFLKLRYQYLQFICDYRCKAERNDEKSTNLKATKPIGLAKIRLK